MNKPKGNESEKRASGSLKRLVRHFFGVMSQDGAGEPYEWTYRGKLVVFPCGKPPCRRAMLAQMLYHMDMMPNDQAERLPAKAP